ncbi:hypothetical protein DNTS_021284 [Danionella cerebrum]|uniref:SCP domain-containing protein n=1 Tax=Danionella cerebrum TaxID=2873325 RepID=A0A553MMB1_9TELE|nr:hypothetical protein DNTS_021284 [Danionella translucida]
MTVAIASLLFAVALWTLQSRPAAAGEPLVRTSSDPELLHLDEVLTEVDLRVRNESSGLRLRRKRNISNKDMTALLSYHNRVRSQVFPPAANMEYMVWDERLAKSAESWASQCLWEHGPPHVLRHIGQNLSIITGRYKSIIDMIKSWYDERHSFSFPNRCNGFVCTHYTQMVWANSNKIGCAVRRCSNMYVFGKGTGSGRLRIRLDGLALLVPQAMVDRAAKISVTPQINPEETQVLLEDEG